MCQRMRQLGVHQGDRVAIYMPLVPEAVITMLACARIGAIHSVIFAGFSAEALIDRVNDAEAKLVVPAMLAGGEAKRLTSSKSRSALKRCPSVRNAWSCAGQVIRSKCRWPRLVVA